MSSSVDEQSVSLCFISISFFLWILIYCPMMAYNLKKYGSRRHDIVYQSRYSSITVIQCLLLMLKLLFQVFATASAVYLFGHNSLEDDIVKSVDAYLAALFLYCFVWKFWLLSYAIILNHIAIDNEWKSVINSKEYALNKTFYAKYRRSLGNRWCTMWISLVLALCFTSMFVVTHIVYPQFYGHSHSENPYLLELYAGWDYVLPFLFMIAIYLKTPTFSDNFYVHKEMKLIFICLCVQYLVYYGDLIVLSLLPSIDPLIENVMFFVEYQVIIGAQFAAMMVSTFWVNGRCENIIESHRFQTRRTKLEWQCIEIQPKMMTKASTQSEESPHSVRGALYDVLSTEVTYNEFIKHLSKEFSIELLLSLTEMVQFRESIIAQNASNKATADRDDGIKLAPNIPSRAHSSWRTRNGIISRKRFY